MTIAHPMDPDDMLLLDEIKPKANIPTAVAAAVAALPRNECLRPMQHDHSYFVEKRSNSSSNSSSSSSRGKRSVRLDLAKKHIIRIHRTSNRNIVPFRQQIPSSPCRQLIRHIPFQWVSG